MSVMLQMLKGKIHRARLTGCDVDYEGSIEIDQDFLDDAGILPYEKVLVVNATNGSRLETYAIPGDRGSKRFLLNGAAAHLGRKGDIVTIMCFCQADPETAKKIKPNIIVMNEKNQIVLQRRGKDVITTPFAFPFS